VRLHITSSSVFAVDVQENKHILELSTTGSKISSASSNKVAVN
jgi:hypothetical protein